MARLPDDSLACDELGGRLRVRVLGRRARGIAFNRVGGGLALASFATFVKVVRTAIRFSAQEAEEAAV